MGVTVRSAKPAFLTGEIKIWPTNTIPTGWVLCGGQPLDYLTYQTLFQTLTGGGASNGPFGYDAGAGLSATYTADAGTDVLTSAGHGLSNGQIVRLDSTSFPPGGLSLGTNYYVINKTTDTFQLSLTSGGSAIDITTAGSGTQTWISNFKTPDLRGRAPFGKDDMGGTAANRITSGGSGIIGNVLTSTGGTETHTLTTAEMPAHTHGYGFSVANTTQTAAGVRDNLNAPTPAQQTTSTGGGGAHNNMPPCLILNYIIKT